MQTAEQRAGSARDELGRLEEYLGGLPPGGWEQPSACAGWTVADVAAHLAWNARIYIDRTSAALKGEPPPMPPPRPSSRPQKPLNEFVAERAVTMRRELGGKLLETFSGNNRGFLDQLQGLEGDQWETPVVLVPPNAMPLRQLLDLRITELAIHAWDIRAPSDPTYSFDDDVLPVLFQAGRRAVDRSVKPGPQDGAMAVRFEVTGPGSGTVDLVAAQGAAEVREGGGFDPDVTLMCGATTFPLLMYGRVALDEALNKGDVTLKGNTALAARFGGWLTGI